jgi:hypothetical protein
MWFTLYTKAKLLLRPRGVFMDRVLLVESGARPIAEKFLAHLYSAHPAQHVDVLTCYEGEPANFDNSRGRVISIHTAQGSRLSFVDGLAGNRYHMIAILCSGESIMTQWKWAVGTRIPAKLLIVNENADYFWFDAGNIGNLLGMVRHRWGMHLRFDPRLVLEALVAPLVYLYLLANAGWVHARRALRRLD